MPRQPIETTVKVKFVNPAKDGKRNANIKTADGFMYFVPEEHLAYFQEGETYRIGYNESGTGDRTFKWICEVDGHSMEEDKPLPAKAQTPRPASNGQMRAPSHDDKGRDIFLCGVVQQAASSGQFNTEGLVQLYWTMAETWDKDHGSASKPRASEPPMHPGLDNDGYPL